MASSDLVNMGISVVSYTLKDIHDDQVKIVKADLVAGTYNPNTGVGWGRGLKQEGSVGHLGYI